jgi:hypothetical protein
MSLMQIYNLQTAKKNPKWIKGRIRKCYINADFFSLKRLIYLFRPVAGIILNVRIKFECELYNTLKYNYLN